MSSTPAIAMLLAGIIALIAVLTDLRARRIPNWLTGGGLLLGFVANVLIAASSNGASSALSGGISSLVGAALGFGLLIPFYLISVGGQGRAIGAGDVKL